MRGFKERQGCFTRLIFDAMKGQFIDIRLPTFETEPEYPSTVIELKRPQSAMQGSLSIRPLKRKTR
jgi:hypothetical protein